MPIRHRTLTVLSHAVRRPAVLATLAYAAYAVFLTWPLATDPGGLLAGPVVSADLGGATAEVGYVVAHHIFPFAPATLHALNAPFGASLPWVSNWASLPSTGLLYALGYLFGAVAGSGVYLWLSFVASGLSMFLLARRLYASVPAAFLAGFVFAFSPFAVAQIAAHDVYMDGFVLVLAVWRMLELAGRPGVRNALLAGAATALSMWWTPYFILIGGVAFAVMAAVVIGTGAARGRAGPACRAVAVAGLPILALIGALGALAAAARSATAGGVQTQDIDQLYTYSARWAEWLLPDRHNLLFGGLTDHYLVSHLHGSNFGESSVYLGISVLALAAAGTIGAARAIRRRRGEAARDPRVVAAVAGAALAVAAALFSAPPVIRPLGQPLLMPSGMVYELTSTWRDYSRFAELLELGLCLPLAFAVSRLLAGRRRVPSGIVVAGLALVLVIDLWARPPVRAVSATPPPEYVWLRDHPGGTVADYPIEPADDPQYSALFWQVDDGHPLLQGYAEGSESESMKLELADLRGQRTASDLAALGVRYVVVHPGVAGAADLAHRGYVLRFAARTGSVWQVTAPPAPTRVDGLDGFAMVLGRPDHEYRWMEASAVLGVQARGCARCTGTVTFASTSNGVARTLTVDEEGTGRVLARVAIPAGRAVTVRVPGVTVLDGQARLLLSADPGPTPRVFGRFLPLWSVTVQESGFTVAARLP